MMKSEAGERMGTGRRSAIKPPFRQSITGISLPRICGCSVSSTLGDLPIIFGRRTVGGEGPPLWEPDLKLDDTAPFRLSRNHFILEKRDEDYHVRDLCSTLGTIVNGEPIGDHFRTDDTPLRAE